MAYAFGLILIGCALWAVFLCVKIHCRDEHIREREIHHHRDQISWVMLRRWFKSLKTIFISIKENLGLTSADLDIPEDVSLYHTYAVHNCMNALHKVQDSGILRW